MKSLIQFVFLLWTFSSSAQGIVDSKQREIVFQSVNIIPMDKESVIKNQVVVVKNGKIISIGDPGKIKYSKEALVIDGKGKYLMPGLAEMHAHIPPIDDMEPMKDVLLLFAANGITTIRGMLGHPKHLALRTGLQNGEILGPRFITSGPSFSGSSVKSEAEAITMVKNQKQAGYDFLKLHPGIKKDVFNAIVKTAREVNIPFAGHVSFDVGVWRAIEAGYASIDHLDGFVEGLVPRMDTIKEQETGLFAMFIAHLADTTQMPRLMTALRERHVWVVPTQALAERWFAPEMTPEIAQKQPEMIYMKAETVKGWTDAKRNLVNNPKYNTATINNFIRLRRKLIYECNKNGVGLLLGSDAPQVFDVPGFSIHQELKYLVDAGLRPYEALKTGTVHVATYLNRSKDMGTIKEGALSDLVLLGGNPLEDITQTSRIEGVMLGNRWLSKEYINLELKKLATKISQSR